MAKGKLLAVQVVMKRTQAEPYLWALAARVAARPATETDLQKRQFYQPFLAELIQLKARWERGVWSWHPEADEAEDELHSWCDGTVNDAHEAEPTPREEARCFVTLLLMVPARSRNARVLQALMDSIDEEDDWKVSTFVRLFEVWSQMDWDQVLSDAVFVRPRDAEGHGLSGEELAHPSYDYLHDLVQR